MFNIERFRYLSKSFVNFKLSYEEEQEFFLYVEQFSDCVYYNHRFVYRKLFMDYLDDIINFEIFEEKFNSYHMEQLSIATKLPTKMKGFTKIIVRIRETIILVKFREEGPKKEKRRFGVSSDHRHRINEYFTNGLTTNSFWAQILNS